MAKYIVPFINLDSKIIDENGYMLPEFKNFMRGLSDLLNNNFQDTGIKVPDINGDINKVLQSDQSIPDGTMWLDNSTSPQTIKVFIDGVIQTFMVT